MINRRLILIFNDGGDSNHLAGVSKDRARLTEHFSSAEGGAWDECETKVFYNDCTKQKLHDHILYWKRACNIDYWVIVFSGHGYATQNDTFLELSQGNDCGVKEIQGMLQFDKCLLIADSCRVMLNESLENSVVGRERLYSDVTESTLYRARCKELYDKAWSFVYRSSFNAAFAASLGQAANDDDLKGGYYIEALLNAANSNVNSTRVIYGLRNNQDEVISFSQVHRVASNHVVSKSFGTQEPTLIGSYLECIPFIVMPIM